MRERIALATTAAALAFVASYAVQRLGAWWGGEVDPAVIFAQVHTPYYWRVSLAALHAVTVALVTGLGVPPAVAVRWLPRLPWLVGAVVVTAAAAMVLVP